MTISIGSNILALKANRYLSQADRSLQSSLEQLSSGRRINRASDDAAGLAISLSLRSSGRVYTQGIRNFNDGISMLNIADGTIGQLSEVTIRLKELASQAANGTYSLAQRRALHTESDQLVGEFNRLLSTTSFNGRRVLDGTLSSLRLQGGFGTAESLSLSLGQELDRTVGTGAYTSSTLSSLSSSGAFGPLAHNDAVAADFNGDGKLDLAATFDDSFAFQLSIAYGDGAGGFSSVEEIALATSAGSITTGDINGDGRVDLVVADGTSATIFTNTGSSFSQTSLSLGVTFLYEVNLADVNNDSKLDLIYGTANGFQIRSGTGTGTFGSATSFSGPSGAVIAISTGDVNGDGNIDVVTGSSTATVYTYLGSGNGSFATPQTITVTGAGNIRDVVLGDVNRDGYDDIVVASSSNGIHTIRGQGSGIANSYTQIDSGSISRARIADLNGDGLLDIVGGTNTYLNSTGGNFTKQASAFTGTTTAIGDFNNDNAVDIMSLTDIGLDEGVRFFSAQTTQATTAEYLNLNTRQGALSALTKLESLLTRINQEKGLLGANQSRAEIAVRALEGRVLNYESADSNIVSADVAQSSADLTRSSILRNVAASLMAQANLQPQIALSLLRSAG